MRVAFFGFYQLDHARREELSDDPSGSTSLASAEYSHVSSAERVCFSSHTISFDPHPRHLTMVFNDSSLRDVLLLNHKFEAPPRIQVLLLYLAQRRALLVILPKNLPRDFPGQVAVLSRESNASGCGDILVCSGTWRDSAPQFRARACHRFVRSYCLFGESS